MKPIIIESTGSCFDFKRTIEVLRWHSQNLHTLGPLLDNPQAVGLHTYRIEIAQGLHLKGRFGERENPPLR